MRVERENWENEELAVHSFLILCISWGKKQFALLLCLESDHKSQQEGIKRATRVGGQMENSVPNQKMLFFFFFKDFWEHL